MDEAAKGGAARLEVGEHIETGAGGREQHGIAGAGTSARFLYGSFERGSAGDAVVAAGAELRFHLVRRRADENEMLRFGAEGGGQRRNVQFLVRAAGDYDGR